MVDPLSRYLFSGSSTHPSQGGRGPIILMYHGTPLFKSKQTSIYSVTADNFRRQMDLLINQGWTTKRISDLADLDSFPDKTVIITFDDGYIDNYEGAFLPLIERNMCATWFIVTNVIGQNADWLRSSDAETQMLDNSQLIEMVGSGMEIGSHTLSHADLSHLTSNNKRKEIIESKDCLEELLCISVKSFAYPYGLYDESCLEFLKSAGYEFACTVRPGWFNNETNPYLLRRICMNLDDSLSTFARKLTFADCNVSWKKMTNYGINRIRSKLFSYK